MEYNRTCGRGNAPIYARPGMQNRAMYGRASAPACGCGRPAASDMPGRNPANNRMNMPSFAPSGCGCAPANNQMNMPSSAPSGCGCVSAPTPSSCDCEDDNRHMRHMAVGMGYVPMQKWEEMYDPATALCQGCAFPSLNLIFCGKRG